jgi:hypothetical protein
MNRMRARWEYCLINCTRMPGHRDHEHRIVCQVVVPGSITEVEYCESEGSPLEAIARALNDLGRQGWELVGYDTSTNRGVFKRPRAESGGET